MAPKGLLSVDDFNLQKIDINTEYGNQRALTSAVHFNDLLQHQLSSVEKWQEFFEINEDPKNENTEQEVVLQRNRSNRN